MLRAVMCRSRLLARLYDFAPDRVIMKTELGHGSRIKHISSVENDRSCHALFHDA